MVLKGFSISFAGCLDVQRPGASSSAQNLSTSSPWSGSGLSTLKKMFEGLESFNGWKPRAFSAFEMFWIVIMFLSGFDGHS